MSPATRNAKNPQNSHKTSGRFYHTISRATPPRFRKPLVNIKHTQSATLVSIIFLRWNNALFRARGAYTATGRWARSGHQEDGHELGTYPPVRNDNFVFEAKSAVSIWRFGGAKLLLLHRCRCSFCHGFPRVSLETVCRRAT